MEKVTVGLKVKSPVKAGDAGAEGAAVGSPGVLS